MHFQTKSLCLTSLTRCPWGYPCSWRGCTAQPMGVLIAGTAQLKPWYVRAESHRTQGAPSARFRRFISWVGKSLSPFWLSKLKNKLLKHRPRKLYLTLSLLDQNKAFFFFNNLFALVWSMVTCDRHQTLASWHLHERINTFWSMALRQLHDSCAVHRCMSSPPD